MLLRLRRSDLHCDEAAATASRLHDGEGDPVRQLRRRLYAKTASPLRVAL